MRHPFLPRIVCTREPRAHRLSDTRQDGPPGALRSLTVDRMGGQVLGGGVIVAVTVLLWLVYLLPSWHSRRQYDAAERNAVRLNQALRVLAETA